MLLSLVTLAKEANVEASGDPAGAVAGVAHNEAPASYCDVLLAGLLPAYGPDCEFANGYVDGLGPLVYLRHLLQDVRQCEGEWRTVYDNGYVSAFQFTPGSWSTAARATGMADPLDPYQVGVNVAWWIAHIADPGSTEGWPTCWHRGSIP